jgi:phosphomannomutase
MRRLIVATEGERRQLVDGVKLWKSDDEWVLIIPHSDRPYFVITAESPIELRADQLIAEYSQLVERWRDEA